MKSCQKSGQTIWQARRKKINTYDKKKAKKYILTKIYIPSEVMLSQDCFWLSRMAVKVSGLAEGSKSTSTKMFVESLIFFLIYTYSTRNIFIITYQQIFHLENIIYSNQFCYAIWKNVPFCQIGSQSWLYFESLTLTSNLVN